MRVMMLKTAHCCVQGVRPITDPRVWFSNCSRVAHIDRTPCTREYMRQWMVIRDLFVPHLSHAVCLHHLQSWSGGWCLSVSFTFLSTSRTRVHLSLSQLSVAESIKRKKVNALIKGVCMNLYLYFRSILIKMDRLVWNSGGWMMRRSKKMKNLTILTAD